MILVEQNKFNNIITSIMQVHSKKYYYKFPIIIFYHLSVISIYRILYVHDCPHAYNMLLIIVIIQNNILYLYYAIIIAFCNFVL